MESNLCTTDQLKQLTPLSENIDVGLLHPHLMIAQQLFVQSVLGDALYNDLLDKFDNNTLSGDTETLYNEYIIPCIGFGAWYNAAPFLNYKTQRTGIATQGTDVLTPVTPEEFHIYITRVENLKTFYQNRMEQYLIDNKTLFPLYRQDNVNQNPGGSMFLGFKTSTHRASYWDRESGENYTDDITSDC